MDKAEQGLKLIKDIEGLPKERPDEYDAIYKTDTLEIDTAELDTMSDNKLIADMFTQLKGMLKDGEYLVDIRLDRKFDVFMSEITMTGFVRKS